MTDENILFQPYCRQIIKTREYIIYKSVLNINHFCLCILVKTILLPSGKKLKAIDGFTFHRNGSKRVGGVRWFCSNRRKGCPVYITLNEVSLQLVKFFGEHNHIRPQYVKMGDYHVKV